MIMIEDIDCMEPSKKELVLNKHDKMLLEILYHERKVIQNWLMDIDERIMRIENGKSLKQD